MFWVLWGQPRYYENWAPLLQLYTPDCPNRNIRVLVAPYRAILRYCCCDTPYRAILLKTRLRLPPKWCDTPPLILSFTQAHLCDAPFCNVLRDNRAIPHKNHKKQARKNFAILSLQVLRAMKTMATGPLSSGLLCVADRHISSVVLESGNASGAFPRTPTPTLDKIPRPMDAYPM